jgi:uncharacterized protein (TIGR02231 family)
MAAWLPVTCQLNEMLCVGGDMKTIRVILVAILFLFSFSTFCTAIEIKRAIVYDDSAYLSLDREVHGHSLIEGPPEMVPESLTLASQKPGIIRSVSVEPLRSVSGKAKDLKDTLAKKTASLASARKEQAMVEKQIEVIYDAAGSKGKATSFEKARLADALGFIENRVTGLNNRLVTLAGKTEWLEIEIKDLQEQLNSVSRNPGYTIDIVADGMVEISYVIRGTSWKPEYRVYASPDTGKISLDVSARVWQSSGVDWDIKELVISTGRPGYGIQAPEIQPWYLYKASPVSRRKAKVMDDSLVMEALQSAAASAEAAPQVEATATSYLIGAARNIRMPGDGTPSTIQLQKQQLSAEYMRVTAPKYSQQVFLRAESTLQDDMPVVPGPYSAFVDGVFSGRGEMGRTEPGQKTILDLGIDEGIKVERKELKVFHEKTLTGKDRSYSYLISIENTRNIRTEVTVKDQLPVSRDEAITVDLIKTDPQVKPDQDGILIWSVDLGPRKKAKVEFSFSITGILLRTY